MTVTIHFEDGTTHTLPFDDAVVVAFDTSSTPKQVYRRLDRDYPPEYVKTANIRASVLSPGTRVMTNGSYKIVASVVAA